MFAFLQAVHFAFREMHATAPHLLLCSYFTFADYVSSYLILELFVYVNIRRNVF